MDWFIAGLLFSFFGALTMLVNQKFKLEGHLISGMRGVGIGVAFWFALPFVEFPKSILFWCLILFQACISTFFNARLYESSARYGADSTARISVLAIAYGMVFWWIVDFERFFSLLDSPFVFTGIIISLILISWGFYYMALQKSVAQKGEIAYLMPAVIVSAIMLINRKEVMEHADFMSAAIYYCAVSIFISGVANLFIYGLKKGFKNLVSELKTPHILKAGAYMAMASAATILCGNTASYFVPNPAFVNAITLTTPLIIIAINRFYGRCDKISWKGTIIMLIGLCALIYFADSPIKGVQW